MTDALFVRSDRLMEVNTLKNKPINPFERIVLMKKVKPDPDPPERNEFIHMINTAQTHQIKYLCSLAVYTGYKHGEHIDR